MNKIREIIQNIPNFNHNNFDIQINENHIDMALNKNL